MALSYEAWIMLKRSVVTEGQEYDCESSVAIMYICKWVNSS